MGTEENRKIILAKRPKGFPDESCFRLEDAPIPKPAQGQVLIKTLYISVDPYMRGRMNDRKSYIPPFALNEPINGGAVGQVAESRSARFAAGEFVTGMLPWQRYSVADDASLRPVDPDIAPITTALGVLGLTGLTAYFGLLDIGKPESGETVVVSGAAGAVGMMVGQIAKIKECRVVGIAGSDRKTSYLAAELGFDAAINYKNSTDVLGDLSEACPAGIDIYFDNVGGQVSDAVLNLINDNARIPLCGQIALYNEEKISTGPRVQPYLLSHSALMKGFLISGYAKRYGEALPQLAAWLKEGRITNVETVTEGLESAPRAFLGLFSGNNLGKQLVKVL